MTSKAMSVKQLNRLIMKQVLCNHGFHKIVIKTPYGDIPVTSDMIVDINGDTQELQIHASSRTKKCICCGTQKRKRRVTAAKAGPEAEPVVD